MLALAELAEQSGQDLRVTRQQNLVLTGVAEDAVDGVSARLAELGFPLEVNPIRAGSIGCTGEPHCNFSVTETKTRLAALVEGLEARFGDDVADLKLHLDGCPHACAQHWVGDIGFQGSTVRDETRHAPPGLRGLPARRARARRRDRPRRLPPRAHRPARRRRRRPRRRLARRAPRRRELPQFTRRLTDAELGALAGIDPAPTRATEEAAA